MDARSIRWPEAGPPGQPPEAPPQRPPLDWAALAAGLGPELSRLVGARISAAVETALPEGGQPLLVARLPLARPAGARVLAIACPAPAAAHCIERLFGARAGDAGMAGAAEIAALPPGSASWAALGRTLAAAVGRALAQAGGEAGGSAQLTPRPLPFGEEAQGFRLDIEGVAIRLFLGLEMARPTAPPAPPGPDRAQWQRRAEARALDMELPVSLRLSEQRISLAEASRLRAGDVLPLDRPETLELLAGGQPIARLPTGSLIRPPMEEPE